MGRKKENLIQKRQKVTPKKYDINSIEPSPKERAQDINDSLFIEYLALGYSGTAAYMKAFGSSWAIANGCAYKKMNRPGFKEAIEKRKLELAPDLGLDKYQIVYEVQKLIHDSQINGDRANWLRGLDMLAKISGIYSAQKVDLKVTEHRFDFDIPTDNFEDVTDNNDTEE